MPFSRLIHGSEAILLGTNRDKEAQATARMNPEVVMLNKRSQSQKVTRRTIPFLRHCWKDRTTKTSNASRVMCYLLKAICVLKVINPSVRRKKPILLYNPVMQVSLRRFNLLCQPSCVQGECSESEKNTEVAPCLEILCSLSNLE